jgi:hypothetical protein
MASSWNEQFHILEHPTLSNLWQQELIQHLEWGVKWELARLIQSRQKDNHFLNHLYDEILWWKFGDLDETKPTASGIAELRRIESSHNTGLDQGGGSQEQDISVSSYL